MLVFVIGKSGCAKILADKLAENKNDIIFTTAECNLANHVDIPPLNAEEIKEFVLANEISLLIVADNFLPNIDYNKLLCDTECMCFCPEIEGLRLASDLYHAKKFAYKNNLNPSKFSAFDKYQNFTEYLKTAKFPLIISPENSFLKEAQFIAETKEKAKKQAEMLFQTGNKKIITEEYICGTKYTKYLLINNYEKLDFLDVISYFDEASTNNTEYSPKKVIQKIEAEYIPNLMEGILEEGIEYTGILGVSFTADKNNNVYFSNFKSFLSELDIQIAINTVEGNFLDVFNKLITKEIFQSGIIKNSKISLSINTKNGIISSAATTMRNAVRLIEVEGADQKLLDEVISNWRK